MFLRGLELLLFPMRDEFLQAIVFVVVLALGVHLVVNLPKRMEEKRAVAAAMAMNDSIIGGQK